MSITQEIVVPSEWGNIHLTIVGYLKPGEYGMVTAQMENGSATTVHHGDDKKTPAKDAIKRLLIDEKFI